MAITSLVLVLFIVVTVMFIFKFGALLSWRLSSIVCSLYLLGLLVLLPVLNWLPQNGFAKQIGHSASTFTPSDYDLKDLAKSVAQGKQDNLQGLYKNSHYTFSYNGKKLGFNLPNAAGFNGIVIERKDVDDGQIEVSTYVTSQFVQGIDFTKQVLPPLISLNEGMLYIKSNQPLELNYRQFQADFILDQFNSNLQRNKNDSMNILMGWKAIYIRVPKNIVIDKGNSNVNIFYVNHDVVTTEDYPSLVQ